MSTLSVYPLRQTGAVLLLGSAALAILGLQPILLGELVTRHAATMEGVGLIAMGEILALGVGVALGDALLPPHRYRAVAVAATLAAALLNAATCRVAGDGPLAAVRALAGLCEGALVWVATTAIVRSGIPDRLTAVFMVTQTFTQASAAALLAALVVPRFGWQGGFLALAGIAAATVLLVPLLPARLPGLAPHAAAAPPRLRGAWAALAVPFCQMAAIGALWAFFEPLGLAAGLAPAAAQSIVSLVLFMQVLGGLAAIALVRRLRPLPTLAAGSAVLAAAAAGFYGLAPGAGPRFTLLAALFGAAWLFLMPFHVARALRADDTGRVATLVPAAQLVGSALGPLLASLTVDGDRVDAVPLVAMGFAVLALGVLPCGRGAPLRAAPGVPR
jgi:MFS family permease